jgi:hypothetical protein
MDFMSATGSGVMDGIRTQEIEACGSGAMRKTVRPPKDRTACHDNHWKTSEHWRRSVLRFVEFLQEFSTPRKRRFWTFFRRIETLPMLLIEPQAIFP